MPGLEHVGGDPRNDAQNADVPTATQVAREEEEITREIEVSGRSCSVDVTINGSFSSI
jgi:hypothetical protein